MAWVAAGIGLHGAEAAMVPSVPTTIVANIEGTPTATEAARGFSGAAAIQPRLTCVANGITYDCSHGTVSAGSKSSVPSWMRSRWFSRIPSCLPWSWIPAGAGVRGAEAAVARAAHTTTITHVATHYVTAPPPRPTTFERARPAEKEAAACSTVYGMLDCPLPYSSPPPATSAEYRQTPHLSLAVGFAIGGVLLLYAIRVRRMPALLPAVLAGHLALANAGHTSVPLPQLAVNTTTFPSTTVTQTVFCRTHWRSLRGL